MLPLLTVGTRLASCFLQSRFPEAVLCRSAVKYGVVVVVNLIGTEQFGG